MDNDKANAVLEEIAKNLRSHGWHPDRAPGSIQLPARPTALEHILWMCYEARDLPADKLEKKMRWLGFIQGVLWTEFATPIDELKKMNMPEGEKTDD